MSKSQLSSFAFLAVVFLLIAAINANELDKAEKEILELISQKVLSSRINDYGKLQWAYYFSSNQTFLQQNKNS